jgi:hypothetical protein
MYANNMEPNMEQSESVKLNQLIEAAKIEDWSFVDGNINGYHLEGEPFEWAMNAGLTDADKNVRDLAATLLDKSDETIDTETTTKLLKTMADDDHNIVRYRLAIALYKRGDRSPSVIKMMQEAKNDPDVGELASSYN